MARQGFYRRSDNHVAVKHIRLTSKIVLEPGTKVDNLPGFQKANLFRRRMIGVAGSDWANQIILGSKHNLTKLKPEVADIKAVVAEKKKVEKVKRQVAKKEAVAIPPNIKVD